MTAQERVAACNTLLLALRPHGHLAESILEPLQDLRDDLARDAVAHPEPDMDSETPTPATDQVLRDRHGKPAAPTQPVQAHIPAAPHPAT